MELTHTFTVPAHPARTWELLTDLNRVGGCFPGATVTDADEQEFTGTVKVKLGPIALTYAGSGRFVERDDAGYRAVIEARGKDRRGNGTASATVTMHLTDDGDGTRAEVLTDLSITGKPAQFGRGVMQDVSDKLLGQFVACIEDQFAGAEPPAQAGTAPPAAPTTAAPATAGPTAAELGPQAAPSPSVRPAPTEPAMPVSAPRAPHAGPGGGSDDAIDLGSAVLPVLLRRYAAVLAAGLGGLAVGVLLGRAGRR